MSIPSLREEQIRPRATASSWARGQTYFEDGSVLEMVWREGTLSARVQGSEYEPYRVEAVFASTGKLLHATCTCPYSGGGDCKHIVAALLYLVHRPDEIEQRPGLHSLLEPLTPEQVRDLILRLADEQPDLIESIESLIPLVAVSPQKGPAD